MDLFRAIFADSDESSSSSSEENSDAEDPELDRQKNDGKMSISGISFVKASNFYRQQGTVMF